MINITNDTQAAKIEEEKYLSRCLEIQRCHAQAASIAMACNAKPKMKATITVASTKTFPLDGEIELKKMKDTAAVAIVVKAATNMVFSQGFIQGDRLPKVKAQSP
jgi:hypothetical protein